MSSLLTYIAHVAAPWQSLYSDSKPVAVTVLFLHVGAILVGGGLALAADRQTLAIGPGDVGEQRRHLRSLHGTHPIVIGALVVVATSGLLMFAADVNTFGTARIFWAKMVLVAALLVNGLVMRQTETALLDGSASGSSWGRMRTTARISAVLWITIVLAGTILSKI